jgi:hypothetical protein
VLGGSFAEASVDGQRDNGTERLPATTRWPPGHTRGAAGKRGAVGAGLIGRREGGPVPQFPHLGALGC